MTIKKVDDEWCVFTKDGKKNLGCHKTEDEAKKHLAAIEAAKHSKKETSMKLGQAFQFRGVELISRTSTFRAEKLSDNRLTVIATSEVPDDWNTIIKVDGWDLDQRYKENPVVLWNHDASSMTIANVTEVRKGVVNYNGKQYAAEYDVLDFPTRDTYAFGHLCFRMMDGGFLRGVSPGFVTTQKTIIEDNEELKKLGLEPRGYGAVLEKMVRYELSVLPLQSNPVALKQNVTAALREMRCDVRVGALAKAPSAEEKPETVNAWAEELFVETRSALAKAGGSAPAELVKRDKKTMEECMTHVKAMEDELAALKAKLGGEETEDEDEGRLSKRFVLDLFGNLPTKSDLANLAAEVDDLRERLESVTAGKTDDRGASDLLQQNIDALRARVEGMKDL